MINREILETAGYKLFPAYKGAYCVGLWQKRISDSFGTRYFVNFIEWDYPNDLVRYAPEVQFKLQEEGAFDVAMHSGADMTVEDVETFFDNVWSSVKPAYYEVVHSNAHDQSAGQSNGSHVGAASGFWLIKEIDRLRPHYQSQTSTDQARRQMLDHFSDYAKRSLSRSVRPDLPAVIEEQISLLEGCSEPGSPYHGFPTDIANELADLMRLTMAMGVTKFPIERTSLEAIELAARNCIKSPGMKVIHELASAAIVEAKAGKWR